MSHELVTERLMDAPVAALWHAYTHHLHGWLCPRRSAMMRAREYGS